MTIYELEDNDSHDSHATARAIASRGDADGDRFFSVQHIALLHVHPETRQIEWQVAGQAMAEPAPFITPDVGRLIKILDVRTGELAIITDMKPLDSPFQLAYVVTSVICRKPTSIEISHFAKAELPVKPKAARIATESNDKRKRTARRNGKKGGRKPAEPERVNAAVLSIMKRMRDNVSLSLQSACRNEVKDHNRNDQPLPVGERRLADMVRIRRRKRVERTN